MQIDFNNRVSTVVDKANKLVEMNNGLREKINELEDQVLHLQEVLTALQAEHNDLQNQLEQRNLALTVSGGGSTNNAQSAKKIADLIREIDRCMQLLNA